jgi:hypothetical protein
MWVKLDVHGLPCAPDELQTVIRSARFEEPTAFELTYLDGFRITPADVPHLEQACGMLSRSGSVRLCPAEIQEHHARVLVGAASKHVRGRDGDGLIRLTKVETSVLPGGRSSAKIVRIIPDDGGPPLVAKMDEISRLEEEMLRFQRYASRWDDRLAPRLHFHAGTGLILFALVDSPDAPGTPAPTLDERIEAAVYGEHWREGYRGPAEVNLCQVIDRTIATLERLNRQPCNDRVAPSRAWIGLEPLEATLVRGIHWSILGVDGTEVDAFAYRRRATRIAGSLSRHDTVHGDVHLRNILVRDDREPHFIDYACCGPGHPCFDLVRLESALLFTCFRMTADELTIARTHHALLSGASEADIAGAFPALASSVVNRRAIRAGVRCRETVLRMMRGYNGEEDDYLALKYIVACQSLFLQQTQKGVVRPLLGALATLLARRRRWQAQADGEGGAE